MALLLREEGAEAVRDAIYSPGLVRLPFVALMEIEYKLRQRKPEIVEESLSLIEEWPVALTESYYSWRREAARVKAEAKVSFADAWIAALALLGDAELVHKDPEFENVNGLRQRRLPYGRQTRPSGRDA
jgi:predicted nucleic acid-binding protein